MINFIIIAILLAIIGAIVFYLVREKKRGVACVGCPYAKECAKKKSGQHSCDCGCGQPGDEP